MLLILFCWVEPATGQHISWATVGGYEKTIGNHPPSPLNITKDTSMSRKVPETSFPYEKEAEENDTQRTDPPGFFPWSNPNELEATDRNITQGTGTSGTGRMVSSTNQQDTSPGAEVLCQPGPALRPPVFIKEERPGGVLVPGIDSNGLMIEEGYDEQVTIASGQESTSTFDVSARTVDTEE